MVVVKGIDAKADDWDSLGITDKMGTSLIRKNFSMTTLVLS